VNLPPWTNTHSNEDEHTLSLHKEVPTVPLKSNRSGANAGRHTRWSLSLVFIAGIVAGIVLVLLLLLVISPDRSGKGSTQTPSNGSIMVGISRNYLALVITKQLKASGLPGTVSNVQVALAQNNLVTVSGDDQIGVLGLSVTRHFTITLQLSSVDCQIHATVTHADLNGIPVTGFVSLFESQLNQKLQSQQSGLPTGFTYCMTGVQAQTNEIVLTYSATPTS
jgi:hypothetical protein